MKNVFESLRKMDIALRKAVLYGVLFVLAVPLVVIMFLNLQGRMTSLESENVFENIEGPDFESNNLDGLLAELEELEKLMASSTLATGTDVIIDDVE